MNLVILHGRAVKDAEARYSASGVGIATYTLAVDRHNKEKETDFINCKTFGKGCEFAEKFIKKGTELVVVGRIQTGSYEKDDKKYYTTDIIVDRHEFAGSKANNEIKLDVVKNEEEFMSIPDNIQEELPFI